MEGTGGKAQEKPQISKKLEIIQLKFWNSLVTLNHHYTPRLPSTWKSSLIFRKHHYNISLMPTNEEKYDKWSANLLFKKITSPPFVYKIIFYIKGRSPLILVIFSFSYSRLRCFAIQWYDHGKSLKKLQLLIKFYIPLLVKLYYVSTSLWLMGGGVTKHEFVLKYCQKIP